MLPTRVLLYGKDEPLPQRRYLRAGPLSAVWENGDLRYIKLGQIEILRRIYVAIRDRNWGTVQPEMSALEMNVQADSFSIRFDVANRQGEIDFTWRGEIIGEPNGTIRLSMDGVAQRTFLRNRIGICVLHPAQVAGAPARVTHRDGTVETGDLPIHLTPSQPVLPFTDMQAMSHEVSPGVWAKVQYTGEVFEMEDQRNWTDTSYKTFGTPLSLPTPVEIPVGETIRQSVTLSIHDERPIGSRAETDTPSELTIDVYPEAPSYALPEIGLGKATHEAPLSDREITRLRALHLDHLRADVQLAQPDDQTRLRRAVAEAAALNLPLHLALFVTPEAADEELAVFRKLLDAIKPPVDLFLIYPVKERFTGGTPVAEVVAAAQRHLADWPGARFASGTNTDFIFMARSLPPLDQIDALAFAVQPQEHAFDNASLMETLSTQATVAAGARRLGGGLPVMVSPVTLKRRFNPHATTPEPPASPDALPSPVDARQMSLSGAAWTMASIRYLAEGGVASITYFETTGPRGVMETEAGSRFEPFKGLAGMVYPLYHILRETRKFKGGDVLQIRSSDPLAVDGLALCKGDKISLLVSNMTGERKTVQVRGLSAPMEIRVLDSDTVVEAMREPEEFPARMPANTLVLDLAPYATRFLAFDRPERIGAPR